MPVANSQAGAAKSSSVSGPPKNPTVTDGSQSHRTDIDVAGGPIAAVRIDYAPRMVIALPDSRSPVMITPRPRALSECSLIDLDESLAPATRSRSGSQHALIDLDEALPAAMRAPRSRSRSQLMVGQFYYAQLHPYQRVALQIHSARYALGLEQKDGTIMRRIQASQSGVNIPHSRSRSQIVAAGFLYAQLNPYERIAFDLREARCIVLGLEQNHRLVTTLNQSPISATIVPRSSIQSQRTAMHVNSEIPRSQHIAMEVDEAVEKVQHSVMDTTQAPLAAEEVDQYTEAQHEAQHGDPDAHLSEQAPLAAMEVDQHEEAQNEAQNEEAQYEAQNEAASMRAQHGDSDSDLSEQATIAAMEVNQREESQHGESDSGLSELSRTPSPIAFEPKAAAVEVSSDLAPDLPSDSTLSSDTESGLDREVQRVSFPFEDH